MLATETSPPNNVSPFTCAEAFAVADGPESADALAVTDPVVTTGVAPQHENPPANWTVSVGAVTVAVLPPAWPGTTTRIP
jgi:hypothetical protein